MNHGARRWRQIIAERSEEMNENENFREGKENRAQVTIGGMFEEIILRGNMEQAAVDDLIKKRRSVKRSLYLLVVSSALWRTDARGTRCDFKSLM